MEALATEIANEKNDRTHGVIDLQQQINNIVLGTEWIGIGFNTIETQAAIKIGDETNEPCVNGSGAGSIRYNLSTSTFEGCNGDAWRPLDVGFKERRTYSVSASDSSTAAGEAFNVNVFCNQGDRVLSGGFNANPGNGLFVNLSQPFTLAQSTNNFDGRTVTFYDTDGGNQGTAYALCSDETPDVNTPH